MKAVLLLLLWSLYLISSVLGDVEMTVEPSHSYNRPMTLNLRLRGGQSQLSPFERFNSNMNMIDLRPRLALPRIEHPSPIPSYLARTTPISSSSNSFFAAAAAAATATANARGPSFVMPSGKSLFEDQLSSRQPPNIHHDPTTLMGSQNSVESLSDENPLKSLLNTIHLRLFGNNIDKPLLFRNQGSLVAPEFDSPSPFLVDRTNGFQFPVDDDDDAVDDYDDDYDDADDDGADDDGADDDDLFDDDFIKKLFQGDDDYDDADDDDYDDDMVEYGPDLPDFDGNEEDDAVSNIIINRMASMQSLFNAFLFSPSNRDDYSAALRATNPCLRGSSVQIISLRPSSATSGSTITLVKVYSPEETVTSVDATTASEFAPSDATFPTAVNTDVPEVVSDRSNIGKAKPDLESIFERYDKYFALASGAIVALAIVLYLHCKDQEAEKDVVPAPSATATAAEEHTQQKKIASAPNINKLFTIEQVSVQPVE